MNFPLFITVALNCLLGLASRPERSQNPRIVGGFPVPTNPYAYPFVVAISYGNQQYCGGTLISPNYVLTAAHCDVWVNDDLIFGTSDYLSANRILIKAAQVIAHPNYNPDTLQNDICLVRLSRAVTEFSTFSKVLLAANGTLEGANSMATLVGWGLLTEGGSSSQSLRQVSVPVVSPQSCANIYPGAIVSSMICAGDIGGGKDSCQGDSGGPMFVNGVQVGIVSWGEGCAQPGYVGVYTRVSSFGPWLTAMMPANTNAPTITKVPSVRPTTKTPSLATTEHPSLGPTSKLPSVRPTSKLPSVRPTMNVPSVETTTRAPSAETTKISVPSNDANDDSAAAGVLYAIVVGMSLSVLY